MELFYHNPLLAVSLASNYIGTNPLEGFSITPDHMKPALLNPSLYDNFTFREFPALTVYNTTILHSEPIADSSIVNGKGDKNLGAYTNKNVTPYTAYQTQDYFSTQFLFSTQLTVSNTHYASYQMLYPVTFSERFGTVLQTISNVEYEVTDVLGTYEYIYSTQYNFYHQVVTTYILDFDTGIWTKEGSNTLPTGSYLATSGLDTTLTIGSQSITQTSLLHYTVGSSMFVEMLGSNVYTGLLVTTNSVIIHENEQISSYYSESLSYEINVANLTAALNSVSSTNSEEKKGRGIITITNFAWTWFTTTNGWSGSQLTNFSSYLCSTVVNDYLYYTYNGTTITDANIAITQVQSLITIENNNLSNAQTFLNDSVTQLQSDISLAGEIIGSLASMMQTILGYF
ncbi:MAG: hypothetical protein ACH346_01760 [Chthoniobacterales bacterium]